MEYRKLGETNLEVSAITFGAWAAGGWMWGGNDDQEAINAMKAAYDLGITTMDTAPIYGQGKSEELVGQAIKDLARDKVITRNLVREARSATCHSNRSSHYRSR